MLGIAHGRVYFNRRFEDSPTESGRSINTFCCRGERVKLFDPKCFELAESFLSDSSLLRGVPGKADELASEIQQCIEDWIQGEEARIAEGARK
jgi:hypothetical protein